MILWNVASEKRPKFPVMASVLFQEPRSCSNAISLRPVLGSSIAVFPKPKVKVLTQIMHRITLRAIGENDFGVDSYRRSSNVESGSKKDTSNKYGECAETYGHILAGNSRSPYLGRNLGSLAIKVHYVDGLVTPADFDRDMLRNPCDKCCKLIVQKGYSLQNFLVRRIGANNAR